MTTNSTTNAIPNSPRSAADVTAFFNAHWTVRKYKHHEMPPDHLNALMHAAQRAPTDATAQMYSFIRLKDPKLRDEMAELTTNPHIATASLAFLVCADVHRLDQILKTHDSALGDLPAIANHFAIGDAVMAGQNLLIAAEMLGYRGCWIGGVLNSLDRITEITRLPKGVLPFAALTIGVPDEDPTHRPRLERNLVFHEDSYRSYDQRELEKAVTDMAAITGRGNWAVTLARYFAKDGTMEKREPFLKNLIAKQFGR